MYQPQDFYFQKAKKEGYPARSVYKLKEIDEKHRLIKPGQHILDLGCAPGSWSSYVSRQIGASGKLLGVDLKAVDLKIPNGEFLEFDVFSISCDEFKEIMLKMGIQDGFDGIVSDMAPSTSGIKGHDAGRSADLAEKVISLANSLLKKKGFLVMKIMEGGEHDLVWQKIKKDFRLQKQIRPKAVRRNSREIYIVANGFKRV
jgi:23S rRNA (uridine2552-2'-O)-methyltransferase